MKIRYMCYNFIQLRNEYNFLFLTYDSSELFFYLPIIY